jgi:DNA phosphorothioation system restriction enzyme
MSLRDLDLKRRYRSNEDDLLSAFWMPCLSQAVAYRRAAGYFSSAALGIAAEGVEAFVKQGGEMKLVVSPELRSSDYESAEAGYRERAQRAREAERTITARLLSEPTDEETRRRLSILGWLISHSRLEIKIAVVARDREPGIYHEKFGLFEDASGARVAFHGSANESRGGLRANFESIFVFRSWIDTEESDIRELETEFDALWRDQTPYLEVYDFPEAARAELINLAPAEPPAVPDASDQPTAPAHAEPDSDLSQPRRPQIPEGMDLRDYQRDALGAFFSNHGRGILEMATGTGKTFTGLSAFERLYRAMAEQRQSLMGIIVCPYQHLVEQWADAARAFGVEPVLCYRSRAIWSERLASAIRAIRQGAAPAHLAIATNATFGGQHFRSMIADCPPQSLIIGDEVHNLGAPDLRKALPEHFEFRLALSATPDRFYDEEGTEALRAYFGDVVFRFGMAEAIESGALTPYEYGVSVVELDGDELDVYLELTTRIARAIGVAGAESEPAQALLVARARIVANAAGKLNALRTAIEPLKNQTHTLVYCGDGSIEGDTGIDGTRQIESVVRMLGVELGMRVAPYTADTPVAEREELRKRFALGDLQVLVAIRCLDEGVDIPETERAFILASSTNPRQYVQRRGRVLRLSPQTGKERAYVHDFLAVPPRSSVEPSLWSIERRLVRRELERVVEFAELATNGPAALDSLAELRERYELIGI